MPLSIADAAKLNNAITQALDAVGKGNSSMPTSSSNTDAFAYNLLISQRMKSYAEAFHKSAVKDAIEAGVLFDHSKEPRQAGVDEDVYSGDLVRVNLKTKNGSTKTDWKAVGKALVASGAVTQKFWDQTVDMMTAQNAAPHTFTASLKT